MKVLQTRNVHAVLPEAIRLLYAEGIQRDSRNGPVLQYPTPVTTVYERPLERVLFWPERDVNPFFHLYESLWMLAGRNDVAGPARYAGNMKLYSDDGVTFHGAYGHRWRRHFSTFQGPYGNPRGLLQPHLDQLYQIAKQLQADPTDRRCVLQMWDAPNDLGLQGKDFPCNTIATFQINPSGELDLSLFCRSNDIIWGAYGANAVHFSFLLEYMALWIGVPVGRFYQTSVNWHGYLKTLEPVKRLADLMVQYDYANPYKIPTKQLIGDRQVVALPLAPPGTPIEQVDAAIRAILHCADTSFAVVEGGDGFDKATEDAFKAIDAMLVPKSPFFNTAFRVLHAHALYKRAGAAKAIEALETAPDTTVDWIVAAREWLERRVK